MFGEQIRIPVVYFTQLMGTAFGLQPRDLGLHRVSVPFRAPEGPVAAEGGVHVDR